MGRKHDATKSSPGDIEDAERRAFLRQSAWLGVAGLGLLPGCGDLTELRRSALAPFDEGATPAIRARNARSLCQQGCDACSDACPQGVDVADALRAHMYANDYGRPDIAAREYAAMGAPAAACATCSDPVCLAACPARIDVRTMLRATHRELT